MWQHFPKALYSIEKYCLIIISWVITHSITPDANEWYYYGESVCVIVSYTTTRLLMIRVTVRQFAGSSYQCEIAGPRHHAARAVAWSLKLQRGIRALVSEIENSWNLKAYSIYIMRYLYDRCWFCSERHWDHCMSCKEVTKKTCVLSEKPTYDSGQQAVVDLPRLLSWLSEHAANET